MFNKVLLLLITALSFTVTSHEQLNQKAVPPQYSTQAQQQTASYAQKWWLKRHHAKQEQAKKSQVELLMIGDSITHGWENRGKEIWQRYYQPRKAFNLGFSGDRTEHVLWRLQHGALDNLHPKLTLLLIGTNNTGQRMDPAEHTMAGIDKIIAELRHQIPESKILLLGIFPRQQSPYNEMRLRNDAVNQLLAQRADNRTIYYLDVNHIFLNQDKTLKPSLMPDLLHPNSEGYQLWAQAMEPTIKRLLY